MNKILVLDFGSQYTQLIARRLRELCIFCEIKPYNYDVNQEIDQLKGIILSGSPFSVRSEDHLKIDLEAIIGKVPVLGVCYGAQMMAHKLGGNVEKSDKREYGKAMIDVVNEDVLLDGVDNHQVWMSHGDSIKDLGDNFSIIAKTSSIPVAAFKSKDGVYDHPVYGVQFHPEVVHSVDGKQILENFALKICKTEASWTPGLYAENTISALREQIGTDNVILGLSGGVDSTVAAVLLQKAIGDQLTCIFLDNGLLRLHEFEEVLKNYEGMGLNVLGVDAKDEFLNELDGVSDPETKRKVIGRVFIEVFEKEANKIDNVKWLGQGTIYPDVIESVSVHGPSVTIKSHHNVGGLPDKLNLKLVEPLRMLFKDEVRRVGASLGIDKDLLGRHPFPGPGLAIRLIGAIERDKLELLKKADRIFTDLLRSENLYNEVWQAFVVLLPVKSVGVMGDERTYEYTVVLRSVNSVDGMTAEWSPLPHEFLAKVSSQIINNVKGINRVVYDISTKPPSTIEWE